MAKVIPSWLGHALSAEDMRRIDAAVKNAESKTSAEIVPMIVHRSTLKATGDRILFWICFAFFGVGGAVSLSLMGGLDEALLDRMIEAMGVWPTATSHMVMSIVAEVIVALVAVAVAWAAARLLSGIDAVHRFIFPVGDLALEAEHRAQSEFHASDLRSTKARTGVLLFVSMLEHRAVILADHAITSKLESETWTKTLDALLESIRAGKMGDGYVAAIEKMGALLATHFPIQPGDHNELSDGLRIEE